MIDIFQVLPLSTICVFLIVLLMAGILRGTFGFGDGLLVVPVMMNFLDVNTIVATMVWAEIFMIMILVGNRYHQIEKSLQIGLVKWAILGIPLGLLFLKMTPEHWIKIGFGPVILIFALTGLTTLGDKIKVNKVTEAFFGFIAGILAGAYNANGPAVVTYVSRFQYPPEKFVINLQVHFLICNLFLLTGHFFNGFWTTKVLLLIFIGLPVLIPSLYLGKKLRSFINPERYSGLIFKLLLVMAVVSIFRQF